MERRYISIWFRHLSTDWFTLQSDRNSESKKDLSKVPFVLRTASHGRMMITAANIVAERKGIHTGMVLADARALVPELEIMDDKPDLIPKLLKRLAEWCIRFTPVVGVDPPDGLLLDVSGCSQLWGGDELYINDILKRLRGRGYDVKVAMADTVGVAWAIVRYHEVAKCTSWEALMNLPPESLRLEPEASARLHKLGLHQVRQFIRLPAKSLRRRFGENLLQRLRMAIGEEIEMIEPVIPIEPYQERLPCMEPIVTATGIEIALEELLKTLCFRLQQEQKGIRTAVFKCYRVDGKIEQISIGTNRPTINVSHLYKLFQLMIATIEPALGIELFTLNASKVEDHLPLQEKMWEGSGGLDDVRLSELIDRLAGKIGMKSIHRYVPDEHYWPERSFRPASSLQEKVTTNWRSDKLRPLKLLRIPELIEVTAPIPDYPPMLFRHQGKLHKIVRADGPERIEQEWWLQQGQHRDYYRVEDEDGYRYWLFRLGHYHDKSYQWFIHGFFA